MQFCFLNQILRTSSRNLWCASVLGAIDVLVVDSVAALTPKAEIEEMATAEAWVFKLYAFSSSRVLTGNLKQSNPYVYLINQTTYEDCVMSVTQKQQRVVTH